jgi:hypothetical protein
MRSDNTIDMMKNWLDLIDKADAAHSPKRREEYADCFVDALREIFSDERLIELCNGERDGRCIVLPCKRGDVCYESDAGHGIIKHVVTGYCAAEREIEYADGMHVVSAVTIETRATDDEGLSWPDHYTPEEWEQAPRTREAAEAALKNDSLNPPDWC